MLPDPCGTYGSHIFYITRQPHTLSLLWLWPKRQWQLWREVSYLCCFRLGLGGLCTPRWHHRARRGGRHPPQSAVCSASRQTTSCLLQHTQTHTNRLAYIFKLAGKGRIIKSHTNITQADLWYWTVIVRAESDQIIFLPWLIILISSITGFSPIWAHTV